MTKKTSVVLVDDHQIFRKGLRMLLEDEPDFEIIGEASDGEEAVLVLCDLHPKIAVLDISMPGLNGIQVAEKISSLCPNTKIVALSIHSEKRFVEDMLMAGAAGYILKQSVPEDLVNGIRMVINGESYLSPSITSVVLAGLKNGQFGKQEQADVIPQIIPTKLNPPRVPGNYVRRQGVEEKLEKGTNLPLTLLVAPAGYGKSTSVSGWLQNQSTPFCWIALDETESDLRCFVNYFIYAVKKLYPDSLVESEKALSNPTLPPIKTLATNILNEIGAITKEFIIVLDDIHLVRDKGVYDLLSELLRHPLLNMHLVILGRRDPFLALSGLRGKRMLSDIRVKDLQFNSKEILEYLSMMIGNAANTDLADHLHRKMEGWIAGIQLTIVSSNHQKKLENELKQFDGNNQVVQEYLFNEVLDQYSEEFRLQLMRLAILDRFCGPLCDILIRSTAKNDKETEFDGWTFIKEVKQANLFVVGVDTENEWYRFHPSFKQLLLKQLQRISEPENIEKLHRIAGEWFGNNGVIEKGVRHAILAHETGLAEDIIQKNQQEKFDLEQWGDVEKWLEIIPEEEKMSRPLLLMLSAWIAYHTYQLHGVASFITRIEQLIKGGSYQPHFYGELCLLKGVLSYWGGNGRKCLQLMDEAHELIPDHHPTHSVIEMYNILAGLLEGGGEEIHKELNAKIRTADNKPVVMRSNFFSTMAITEYLDGNLYQALSVVERLSILGSRNNMAFTEMWAKYLFINIHLQLFNLENVKEIIPLVTDIQNTTSGYMAIDFLAVKAIHYFFSNDIEKAFSVADQLKDIAHQAEDFYLINIAHSLMARLHLLIGDVSSAEKSMLVMSSPADYSLPFIWFENPVITRIRVLIAIGSTATLQQGTKLLEEYKAYLISKHYNCHLIDVMLLESLILLKKNHIDEASESLKGALALATKHGWVRPFIEAGQPVLALLSQFETESDRLRKFKNAILTISTVIQPKQPTIEKEVIEGGLSEPLTSREKEILELLGQRLRNKEIAENLFISPETVKSHIKRLFSKLDAVNRRDVVEKAISMNLLKKL